MQHRSESQSPLHVSATPLARLAAVALAALAALAMAPATAEAGKAPRKFYGVSPQTALGTADYSQMAKGRVGTLRVAFLWPNVQQSAGDCRPDVQAGSCDWRALDALVGRAADANVRVQPFLHGTAPFISADPLRPPLSKSGRKAWRDFVQAAVARYGRGGWFWKQQFTGAYAGKPRPIKDWQVWNEPSSSAHWHPKPNPKKYAKLVKHTSKAVRRGDRKGDVILGGLFGTTTMDLKPFLRRFYKVKRIKKRFDAVAVHPYAPDLRGVKIQLRWARQAMRKGGDRKSKLYVTEIGWGSKKRGHPLQKGKKGQAKMLRKSFRLLTKKRRSWKLGAVNWFTWQDLNSSGVCEFCRDAGLFEAGGKAKPSWRAFKRFTK